MPRPRRLPAIRLRPLAVSLALVPAVAALAPAASAVAAASRATAGSGALTIPGTGNAWAVGFTGRNLFSGKVLIEHWDGHAWAAMPVPALDRGDWLTAIAASTARDAWAVGGADIGSGTGAHLATLIMHWDGQAWTRTASPCTSDCTLAGVTAVSVRTTWAVGRSGSRALVLRWNGASWQTVPSATTRTGSLAGVAVPIGDNGWAVGRLGGFKRPEPLIEHWNGKTWMPA